MSCHQKLRILSGFHSLCREKTETRQFKEIETLFFLTHDGVEGPDQKMAIRHTASVDKLETIYIKYFTLNFFCTLWSQIQIHSSSLTFICSASQKTQLIQRQRNQAWRSMWIFNRHSRALANVVHIPQCGSLIWLCLRHKLENRMADRCNVTVCLWLLSCLKNCRRL